MELGFWGFGEQYVTERRTPTLTYLLEEIVDPLGEFFARIPVTEDFSEASCS